MVGFEAAPDPLQLAYPQVETGGIAGQRRDIDGTGRGAAQYGKWNAEIAGIKLGDGLEGTDLIGRASTATGQEKSCVGSGHDTAPYGCH